jgi:hypothetical protein
MTACPSGDVKQIATRRIACRSTTDEMNRSVNDSKQKLQIEESLFFKNFFEEWKTPRSFGACRHANANEDGAFSAPQK